MRALVIKMIVALPEDTEHAETRLRELVQQQWPNAGVAITGSYTVLDSSHDCQEVAESEAVDERPFPFSVAEAPPPLGAVFIGPNGRRRYRVLRVDGIKCTLWNEEFGREETAMWALLVPANGWKLVASTGEP